MSLRGRFVAASSMVAFVTLSASFLVVWLMYTAAQERQLDVVLVEEATRAAIDTSYRGGVSGGRLLLDPGELGLVKRYAATYGSEPGALAWTPNLEPARPRMYGIGHRLGSPFDQWWNNEHLRGVLVPVPGDRGERLWLATTRTDLDQDARDLARRMVGAMLVAVIAAAAAAGWLGRMLTREHDRIAVVVRAVAAGDLSARIGPISGDSEVARLGRDVEDMIARLAILVETQEQFIGNASHELRSPIATLLGELSFALRRDRDAATYRVAIQEALDAARRLKIITDDLLTLARVGTAELPLQSVALSDVIRAAAESARFEAEARGVALELATDDTTLQGQPGDLERLVRNLVENAVRHSPRGGCVRIEASHEAKQVRLRVSDQGPGVPSDARERIFEPFFRLPADRANSSGAGLGLAIGRGIARAHGGDLWVEDSAEGARFVARLPLSGPTTGV